MDLRYSSIVGRLRGISVPVHEIGNTGKVAVTRAAGRIVAMAFTANGANLFWTNPALGDDRFSNDDLGSLPGGLGGDRLWFSPELAYHWDGAPDWQTMKNYKPPVETDPGGYEFVNEDPSSIRMRAYCELPVHGSDSRVRVRVERNVRIAEPPIPRSDPAMRGVEYVGIETSHVLELADEVRTGVVALWHLMQVPAGAVLVVPTRDGVRAEVARPTSYALPGTWVEKQDHIVWRYGGTARAKFGLSAAVVTGRAAVIRKLDDGGRWCMLVREFPFDAEANYCDHPHSLPRTDQVFQAWDGDGFGELEFHSAALDAQHGPRELAESDRLWAFGSSGEVIAQLAKRLLGVNIDYLVA